jgi:prepilin-type processing-associated H-X9-DG protein
MRQIGTATLLYADDNNEQIWEDVEWNFIDENGNGIWEKTDTPGHLYQYVNNADKIGECPTNKRRGVGKSNEDSVFDGAELNFDYCMQRFTSGYRLGSEVRVGYIPPDASNSGPQLKESNYPLMTFFDSVPIFWEESTYWYNDQFRDGLWGNEDQLTTRHAKGGHVWMVDGRVELLVMPSDGDEEVRNGRADFEAKDIFAGSRNGYKNFWQVYQTNSRRRPYGWINNPVSGI